MSFDLVLAGSRSWHIEAGDSAELLRLLPDVSIDAVITDPPAGIGLLGKGWDSDRGGRAQWVAWLAGIMRECLRVLKPGGHALVWALPRTSHWTATAIEDAGFEIRDRVSHLFGEGFPKGVDVAKAIDKRVGHARGQRGKVLSGNGSMSGPNFERTPKGDPVTAAAAWEGWNTALKPACEDWWLARKPMVGATVDNVLAHGVGALNIDGCRAGTDGGTAIRSRTEVLAGSSSTLIAGREEFEITSNGKGRWPSNVVLTHSPGCVVRGTKKVRGANVVLREHERPARNVATMPPKVQAGEFGYADAEGREEVADMACAPRCPVAELDRQSGTHAGDEGGASRFFPTFFYGSKVSTSERERGMHALSQRGKAEGNLSWGRALVDNNHPTVKPQRLMEWLVRLVMRQGGVVLDPFAGSGSTAIAALRMGYRFVGVELDQEMAQKARRRVTGEFVLAHREKAKCQAKQAKVK